MHEALTPPSSSSSDSPYSFTRHASTVTAITGCWFPMPSSGIRSSRSGVSRVVWRARPQDRSTLGPSLTLRKVYQQSDAETMLQVVLDGGELRERKA